MDAIIPLTIYDSHELESIHKACFPDGWSQETFADLLNEKTTCGWAVKSNENKIIGFVLMRILTHEAEILTIAVQPSMQRRGIGRSLLTSAMQFLNSIGCREIFLEVTIDNQPAIGLYQSLGFVKSGMRPDYYKRGPQTFISAYIMFYENKQNP